MAGAAIAGCSGAVEVTLPGLADDPSCAAAAQRWPDVVSGLRSVPLSSTSPSVRAWGDPAVIARCGLDDPGPSTACLTVNGIDWVVSDLSDGKRFVTFGRRPAIEVLVPQVYAPEGTLLPVFTDAAALLPGTGRRCT